MSPNNCPFLGLIRVSSQEKSAGLAVVAAVNDRGEVMAVRDTQRNDGRDVG